MKLFLSIILGVLLLSCNYNTLEDNKLKNYEVDQTILLERGDTARVNLGSFGDEEGAWLFQEPKNAFLSEFSRDLPGSTVYYLYASNQSFFGNDTVGIILNRGSDGASPGINDSIQICFVVN